MSPLLLFMAGAIPSFAAGALARPYIDRLIKEARMPSATPSQPRRTSPGRVRVALIVVSLTAIVACGGFIYTNARVGSVVDCFAAWSRDSSVSTKARADAAQDRDDALVASKKAMRELVRRIKDGERFANSPAITQAADQYIVQTGKFIEASERFDRIRREEPVVLFSADYCRKVADRDN